MPTKRDPIEFTREDPDRPGEGIYERVGNLVSIDSSSIIALIESILLAADGMNLYPNPNGNDVRLPVITVAQDFATIGGNLDVATTHVHVRFETAPLRMTINGNTPIAGYAGTALGTLYMNLDMRWMRREVIESGIFVANTATTAYLHISEYKFTP